MTLLRHGLRLALAASGIALAAVLAACGGEPPPAPAAAPAPEPAAAAASGVPTAVPATAARLPAATPVATLALPPAAVAPTVPPSPTPTPLPVSTPPPRPTPHPGHTAWVAERIEAVVSLYRPTPAGEALLRSLDLRHLPDEPGYFGSYGFDGWAGVGEAKPIPVMHELGHSYWGGFPVIGRPELSWQRHEGEAAAPALAAYHRDVLAFMAQPPDDYEFLRERLRNLPGVSAENTEPVFHSLEADIPYTTGGDLSLVPPILRRYWGHFLTEGPFGSWERALGWYLSLSGEERATANKFLGFEHFDLRLYLGLPAYSPPGDLLSGTAGTLAREERQRLTDLAEHFDLLLGDAQLEENFQFWRGYLRDKLALFRVHPGHMESLDFPRAGDLSDALRFLAGLEGSPASRASALAKRMPAQPFLVNFLPAVDDPTLVELFADGPELPQGPTLQATASFVERLQRFGMLVDGILAAGRKSPQEGARALENFLTETGYGQEQDLQLFFDLLKGADGELARRIMRQTDKATVRALMGPAPVQLRAIFSPEGLLDKLDVTAGAADADLRRGIGLLIGDASGNYRIDEPFLERLYAVMAQRVEAAPAEALSVMAGTPFPVEGMILRQPRAASAALSADMGLAAALVRDSDAVVAPPARIIHRLIVADPALAAGLVAALDAQGERLLATESLAYLAYDKARSEKYPDLPLSLSRDGAFLQSLLERQGEEWLSARLAESVELYRRRAADGEVAPDFLRHFRDTLEAAAATRDTDTHRRMAGIIRAAFG